MAKRVCRQARELYNVRFSSLVVPPSQTGPDAAVSMSDAGREARAPEPYYWALALVPLHALYYRSMVYCLALTGSGDSSGGSSDGCCSGSSGARKTPRSCCGSHSSSTSWAWGRAACLGAPYECAFACAPANCSAPMKRCPIWVPSRGDACSELFGSPRSPTRDQSVSPRRLPGRARRARQEGRRDGDESRRRVTHGLRQASRQGQPPIAT